MHSFNLRGKNQILPTVAKTGIAYFPTICKLRAENSLIL